MNSSLWISSLWINISIFVISLIGIIFIFYLIVCKDIAIEKIEKISELLKWLIVSVGITLSISIINDGIRQRDQDQKEMATFKEYLSFLFNTSDIAKRYSFVEYFSSVSHGHLKEGWQEYRDTIKPEFYKFIYRQERYINDEANNDCEKEKNEKKQKGDDPDCVSKKINKARLNISNKNSDWKTVVPQQWVIVEGTDTTINGKDGGAKGEVDNVNKQIKKLNLIGYNVGIYKKQNGYKTIIEPFTSRNEALAVLQTIDRKNSPFVSDIQTWCKTYKLKKEEKEGGISYNECDPDDSN